MILGSDQGWTLLNIAIIVFMALIVLTYTTFLIIYLRFFKLYHQETKVKNEYNKLVNKFRWNNVTYLETLSNQNTELKQVLDQIVSINDFYDEQVAKVKEKIIKLTEYNHNFHFLQAKRLIKEINHDLNSCNELCKLMQSLYLDATSYNSAVADLIAKPRACYDQLKTFYLKYLSDAFDNEEFAKFHEQISSFLVDATVCQQKIDNEKLLNTLNNINELIKSYQQLVKYCYIYSCVLQYLRNLKTELDNNLADSQRKINETEYTNLQYIQSNIKTSLASLATRIKKLEFNIIGLSITSIVSQLHQSLTLLNKYDRIILLTDNNLEFATATIDKFNENVQILDNVLLSLKEYFKELDTQDFVKMVESQTLNLKKMTILLNTLKKQKNDLSQIDHLTFLKQLYDLLKNIREWSNTLDQTHDKIVSAYRTSIQLIDDVYDLQWVLSQFLNLNSQRKIKFDEQALAIIKKDHQTIGEILNKMSVNFKINDKLVYDTIQDIKTDVINLSKDIHTKQQLKTYARLLIVFANKYRYEDQSIADAINLSEDYYNKGEYASAMDQLLPVLEHIKSSAAKNYVKFN